MADVPDVDERLTWVGHATVLLEIGGVRLLTDPLLRMRLGHLRRHGAPPRPAVTQDIDAVLVSHVHLDHLDVRSLRSVGRGARVDRPPRRRQAAAAHRVRARSKRSSPARASSSAARRSPRCRRSTRPAAVRWPLPWPRWGTTSPAPSASTSPATRSCSRTCASLAGRFDVALLPVWGWGPSLGPGHMDPLSAAQAVALVRPRIAVPIHWGTFFPVGLEALRGSALVEPPRVFARQVAELAPEVEVRVLAPGDELVLGRVAS